MHRDTNSTRAFTAIVRKLPVLYLPNDKRCSPRLTQSLDLSHLEYEVSDHWDPKCPLF